MLEPAEFRITRIVGEQRAQAREHIFRPAAASIRNGLAGTLEELLVVKPDETSSGLQAIKANPSKPSLDAMLTLLDKLRVIEATGVLGVDLLWLNGNYQRALFHQVRKSSGTRLRQLAEPRRHAALVCFLWQSYRDAVDQTVDMFDKLLTRAHTQAGWRSSSPTTSVGRVYVRTFFAVPVCPSIASRYRSISHAVSPKPMSAFSTRRRATATPWLTRMVVALDLLITSITLVHD